MFCAAKLFVSFEHLRLSPVAELASNRWSAACMCVAGLLMVRMTR